MAPKRESAVLHPFEYEAMGKSAENDNAQKEGSVNKKMKQGTLGFAKKEKEVESDEDSDDDDGIFELGGGLGLDARII